MIRKWIVVCAYAMRLTSDSVIFGYHARWGYPGSKRGFCAFILGKSVWRQNSNLKRETS